MTTPSKNEINVFSYKERIKRKGHENDTIDQLLKVVVHEFVHICSAQYRDNKSILLWFNEALSIILSGQYEQAKLNVDCTLEEVLNGKVSYVIYYTLGKYVFEHYDKEYILKLAKDNEFLKEQTPIIYEETKKWLTDI